MTLIVAWAGCARTTPPPPPPLEPTGETATTGPDHTGEPPPGPDLVVTPPTALSLTVSYTLATQQVRQAYDVLVSWSTLTTDGWGDPFATTDPGSLVLLEVLQPPDEVADHLAQDDLGTSLLSTWEADATGRSFAHLSDLRYGAQAFDPAAFFLEAPDKSWVLALARHEGDRLQLRVATILVPGRASTGTAASLGDASSAFTWSATAGAPLLTSARWDAWTTDWSAVTIDALGKPVDDHQVDELVIGRFPAGADLAAHADELATVAEATWTAGVRDATHAELAKAHDASGGAFPGFSAGPVWALWARCSTCLSPFPSWAATVEVEP